MEMLIMSCFLGMLAAVGVIVCLYAQTLELQGRVEMLERMVVK
jgi:hypothetical protein